MTKTDIRRQKCVYLVLNLNFYDNAVTYSMLHKVHDHKVLHRCVLFRQFDHTVVFKIYCYTLGLCTVLQLPSLANWGPWGEWSDCTETCGFNGVHQRERECYYIRGVFVTGRATDDLCEGSATVIEECNQEICCKLFLKLVKTPDMFYHNFCGKNIFKKKIIFN